MGSSCENKINNAAKQETVKNLNDVPVYNSYIADILIRENYKIKGVKNNKNNTGRKNLCVFYFEDTPQLKKRLEELANIRKLNIPKKEE